jgi:hypothetical protein
MVIYINHPNNPNQRIDPPVVAIRGDWMEDANDYYTGAGTYTLVTRTYNTQSEALSGLDTQTTARNVTAREVDAFRNSVTVTLTPDQTSGFATRQGTFGAGALASGAFVGQPTGGIAGQNELAYTYYTLNGKDPKQTKANLYLAPFVVRRNASGIDNYILKTRTYINGISSKVRKVEFRIVRRIQDYQQV